MAAYDFRTVYLHNPWLKWFWEHGGEEPVGPHGPLFHPGPQPWIEGPGPVPWIEGPLPQPWRIAVRQLVQAAQAKDLASRLPDSRLKSTSKGAQWPR
jgi:hypothetical protein